jgi:RNA polymerase sigma-70 factor, ECF subfamily
MVLSRTLAVLWSLSEVAMAEGQNDIPRPAGAESPPTKTRADRTPDRAVDGLLAQVARGDAQALAAVCDQVAGPVYGLVNRIVGDQGRSEQVTEEVLLEVWRTASRFNPSAESGLAWIIAIAQRHAVRAAGLTVSRGCATGTESSRTIGKVGAQAGLALLTHPGIASLPAAQREAILLACCGYTWHEVADLAGVPVGTVAGQLHDGLLQLSRRSTPFSS